MHRAALSSILWFLCLTVATAQEAALPARPKDLEAELAARPIAPAVADGNQLELIDRANDQPVAGADVFVIDSAAIQAVRRPLRALQKELVGDADTYQKLLACWYGTRYRTGADGTVTVAKVAQGTVVAMAPDRFAAAPFRKWPEDQWTLKLQPRVYFEVLVTDAKGKPAAEVPVAFGTLFEHSEEHQWFHSFQSVLTDGAGRARLRQEQVPGRDNPTAQLAVLSEKPIRARLQVDAEGKPKGPVALQLPPCGMVRVLLYDEQEHPLAGLRSVSLTAADGDAPGSVPARPSKQAADSAFFRWVPVGRQLRVEAHLEGLEGALRHDQAGPTRVGEMVVCGVRMTAADPIVRVRVLDAAGAPQGKTSFGFVRAAADTFEGSELTTDADGRLQFTVPRSWLQEARDAKVLLLARGPGTRETKYLGALQVPLAEQAAGILDLGEAKMTEEPVLCAGVVVDGDGKPLPGVVVGADLSHLQGCNSTSQNNGGEKLFFSHRVPTDDQGRFCLRELAPKDVPVPLSLAGGTWVLTEPVAAAVGDAELRLRAVRSGSVKVKLAAKGQPQNATLILKARTEGAQAQHAWVRDGRAEWNDLVPGRYTLSLSALGDDVELVKDLEVKAGEPCGDPRLVDLALSDVATFANVLVRGPDQKPLDGVEVHGLHLHRGGGSATSSVTNRGRVEFILPKKGGKVSIAHEDYRSVTVDDPPADCPIDLVPRARARLRLPDGVALPDGVIVVLQPEVRGWWMGDKEKTEGVWQNGQDVVVRPDREGPLQVEILDAGRQSLWKGKVTVPAGDAPDLPLPLDAAAAAAIREAAGGKR